MNKKKELAVNTAVLTIGKVCTQCITFLLLPLYTAVLDTTEYGTFDLLISYGTLLLPLVNWQFDQGLFRFLLDCRKNKEKQAAIFSTVFAANVIQMGAFLLLFLIIKSFVAIPYYPFLVLYVMLHVITAFFLQFVRGLGNNKVYAISSFVSATSTVVLNVIFLCVMKTGLNGLFVSTLLAQILTIGYITINVKPFDYFSLHAISFDEFKRIRNYSIPLIPNNLAWWVVNVSDRTIVSYVLGVAVNGIYTVANKFSSVFIQFYNIFNLSWTESVSLHFNDSDRDDFLSETITMLFKLFSCACLEIVAVMPFIFPLLVNDRYSEAYPHILILMYAMLFRVFQGLYSCIYIAMKNSKKVATTSLASALINILVDVLLIKRIGLYAASISTLVAFGSMAFLRYIDVNKYVKMKINSRTLILTVLLALILAFTYYLNRFVVNIIMVALITVYAIASNYCFMNQGFKMIVKKVRKWNC